MPRDRQLAGTRRCRHCAELRALAGRPAPEAGRDGGPPDRRPLRRARRDQRGRHRARALPAHRHRRRHRGRDRTPTAWARHPRRADHRRPFAAVGVDRRRSALGRVPAAPSADARLPRRTDPPAWSGVREPLPDRERVRLVHRGGSGARRDPRQPGGRGDRERTPVRSRDELVEAARGAERSRDGARERDRAGAICWS